MRWERFWPYAHTWWGWSVAILSALAFLYYSPRKVLETLDWYWDRFVDYRIREFLHTCVRPPQLTGLGERRAAALPKTVTEIAVATHLSEKKALRPLQRLSRKCHVVQEGERWKIVL
jgi:hypothetical protein